MSRTRLFLSLIEERGTTYQFKQFDEYQYVNKIGYICIKCTVQTIWFKGLVKSL